MHPQVTTRLRAKALRLRENDPNRSQSSIARELGVDKSSVCRWFKEEDQRRVQPTNAGEKHALSVGDYCHALDGLEVLRMDPPDDEALREFILRDRHDGTPYFISRAHEGVCATWNMVMALVAVASDMADKLALVDPEGSTEAAALCDDHRDRRGGYRGVLDDLGVELMLKMKRKAGPKAAGSPTAPTHES